MSALNLLWHCHRRCDNHERHAVMASANDETRTDGQVSLWPLCDRILNCPLNLRTKESAVSCVDAAIHETVAVGRRHHAMLRNSQQITLLNRNLRELPERFGPSIDQVPIVIDEVQTHDGVVRPRQYGWR